MILLQNGINETTFVSAIKQLKSKVIIQLNLYSSVMKQIVGL